MNGATWVQNSNIILVEKYITSQNKAAQLLYSD